MIGTLDRFAGNFDAVRARGLRLGARTALFREIFRRRELRHSVGLHVGMAVQLVLAVRWPIPMAIVGPAFFGAAHLVASLRHGLGIRRASGVPLDRGRTAITASLWIGVALVRMSGVSFDTPFVVELGATAVLVAIWWPSLRGRPGRTVAALGTLPVLFFATRTYPLGAIATVALAHHFVAFAHWVLATRTRAERTAAVAGLSVFALVHGFVFAGAFDSTIGGSEWGGLPYRMLEGMFVGWSEAPMVLSRCLVAYAFGQGVHYLLWLKIIPEQQHPARIPTTFRQSLRILRADLGGDGAWIAIGFVLALFFAACALGSGEFRACYLSLAAMHGFAEIFGLFLIRTSPSENRTAPA